ncbi:Neuropeptide Y receptor type 1 [Trichoplax sp. H2]|nr:Neuropeptide Y receptor type 1 [Trichoplax sp. H2]|eukprot:RDD46482.1 Neuropeptide Y receptor type 1 [Trichoplax sp. H2]
MAATLVLEPTCFNASFTAMVNNTSRLQLQSIIDFSFGGTALIANCCICTIIAINKSLHEPFYYLILNLSLSDTVLAISVVFHGFLDCVSNQQFHIGSIGNIGCKLDIFCAITSFSASTMTLFAISIERYQAISMHRFHTTGIEKTRIIILTTWIFASLTAVIPMIYAKIETEYPYECAIQTIEVPVLLYLELIMAILICFLPITLTLICHGLTACKLYKINTIDPHMSGEITVRNDRIRKNILSVIFISLFSAITGLPLIIVNIATVFDKKKYSVALNPQIYTIAATSFVISPVVNPIVYNFASSKFRQVFVSAFCRKFFFNHKIITVISSHHDTGTRSKSFSNPTKIKLQI